MSWYKWFITGIYNRVGSALYSLHAFVCVCVLYSCIIMSTGSCSEARHESCRYRGTSPHLSCCHFFFLNLFPLSSSLPLPLPHLPPNVSVLTGSLLKFHTFSSLSLTFVFQQSLIKSQRISKLATPPLPHSFFALTLISMTSFLTSFLDYLLTLISTQAKHFSNVKQSVFLMVVQAETYEFVLLSMGRNVNVTAS